MALVFVQRYVVATESFLSGGTQYVEGQLTFGDPTTLVLSSAVFSQTGSYILFDYTGGSFPGGQSELNTNVIPYIDTSNLTLSTTDSAGGAAVLEDDAANSRIILRLVSRPTNGTQYIDGTLDITGPLTLVLNSTLYATGQTYILFDAVDITAGSLANITVQPPAGRYQVGSLVQVPGGLGKQIKVTLA